MRLVTYDVGQGPRGGELRDDATVLCFDWHGNSGEVAART